MNQLAEVQNQEVAERSPLIALIERVVLDPNASIEKLERMLAMQERLEQSQARKAFDFAIAAAKAEIPTIIKDKVVDFTSAKGRTNYVYEDLDSIAKVVNPILSKHGISYRYRTNQDQGLISVTCVMSHRDGHSEETTLQAGRDESGNKNSFQAVGSAVTYLQRYTLKAALGLSAAKDNDAGGVDEPSGSITEEQFRSLRDLLEQSGSDENKFLAYLKIETLHELPASKYAQADALLRKKIAGRN